MNLKLGRRAPSMMRHAMKLHRYFTPNLPPLAPKTNWSKAVTIPWGMEGNDALGDCTCAGPAHNVMAVTANAGSIVVPTTAQTEDMYEASGYVPGNPASDQGWTLDAAESYMVSTGLAGVKADGYVDVGPKNITHIKYALQLLGPGVNFGVNLPQSAMDVFEASNGVNVVWSVSRMTNTTIIGGHDIACIDFTANGNFRCVTWGSEILVTPAWLLAYCVEVSAMYFKMMEKSVGLDYAQMEADAQALAAA